jgi:hypothetical protein
MGRHSTAGTATHPRLAAPSPHGKLSLDSSCSSCKGQQQPILASPHTGCWTAASTHSLFSKSKLAARTKGRRKQRGRPSGNEENKGTNPEKNGREFQHHFSGEIFGGQQGHGRVFNTKFSKDLHVWLKLSLGF